MGLGLYWLLNRILDYVIPPLAIFALLVWAPLLAAYNVVAQFVRGLVGASSANKVVLITGASSGIGENVAYEYARRAARLVLVARRKERLAAVAEQCKRFGAQAAEYVVADTGKEEGCRKAVEETISKFDSLDILVLNAGVGQAHLFSQTESVDVLHHTVDINFWGYVYTALHALPHLKRTRGTIIVNSSIAGFTPFARHSIYGASKAMVTQFFDTLRVEIMDQVHIFIAFPGPVASELTAGKVMKEHGRLEIDQDRRDELIGPQPMLDTSIAAKVMVNSAERRMRYRILPIWTSLFLLYRIFAPEFLFLNFALGQMPWSEEEVPPTKQMIDKIQGQQWLYKQPGQTGEQAQEAVGATAGQKSEEQK